MEDFGTWKDGSSIFKDKKGYYIIQINKDGQKYRKYIKGFKPVKSNKRLILDKKKKKWIIII
jgi:hypothetical protein